MNTTFAQLNAVQNHSIPALMNTPGAAYADSVRVDLPHCSLLYISGKTGIRDGKLVGRSMTDQARQVLENLRASLEQHGGTLADIVRLRIYTTQLDSESIRELHAVRREFFPEGRFPASTLVKIDQLVHDGGVVEMEADVVLTPRQSANA